MQPPKAMGSSLVKILFHICFLNKIVIKKILHTNWFTFSIGFGGGVWCGGGRGESGVVVIGERVTLSNSQSTNIPIISI